MTRIAFLALPALAVLPACAGEDDVGPKTGAPRMDLADPGPGAYDPDFRDSAAFFSRMAAPQPGRSPHGAVQIWYSNNVRDLLDEAEFTVPVGTVAIKTGDKDNDGVINAITVMIKREAGYDPDPDNNDWEYQMRTPSHDIVKNEDTGEPIQGAVGMCIDCHAASARTDFLSGTFLR